MPTEANCKANNEAITGAGGNPKLPPMAWMQALSRAQPRHVRISRDTHSDHHAKDHHRARSNEHRLPHTGIHTIGKHMRTVTGCQSWG